jgi:hypothetical protein
LPQKGNKLFAGLHLNLNSPALIAPEPLLIYAFEFYQLLICINKKRIGLISVIILFEYTLSYIQDCRIILFLCVWGQGVNLILPYENQTENKKVLSSKCI